MKTGFENFDLKKNTHDAYARTKECLRREGVFNIENKNMNYSEKKVFYDKIKADVISEIPEHINPVLPFGLKKIKFNIDVDIHHSQEMSDEEYSIYTQKVKMGAKLACNKKVKEILVTLDDIFSSNKYSPNIYPFPKYFEQNIQTEDGLHGILPVSVFVERNSADVIEFVLNFLVTPKVVQLINAEALMRYAKENNQAFNLINKVLEVLNKPVVEKPKPVTEATKKAVTELLYQIPYSTKHVNLQSVDINHKDKVLNIYTTVSREARHPDEYGEAGKKAEQESIEWDMKINTNVTEPLKKLGYRLVIGSL